MEPYDMFCTIIYKIVAYPLRCVFLNFTNPQFKASNGTVAIIIFMVIYELFCVYTIATNGLKSSLQTIMIVFFGIQV